MAVSLAAGFKINNNEPIDNRLVLTKAQMLAAKPAGTPAHYFALCSDDNQLYVYDETNESLADIGKYRLYAGNNDSVSSVNNVSAVSGNISISASDIPYKSITYYAWAVGDFPIYTLTDKPTTSDYIYLDETGTMVKTSYQVDSYDASTNSINVEGDNYTRDASKDETTSFSIADAIIKSVNNIEPVSGAVTVDSKHIKYDGDSTDYLGVFASKDVKVLWLLLGAINCDLPNATTTIYGSSDDGVTWNLASIYGLTFKKTRVDSTGSFLIMQDSEGNEYTYQKSREIHNYSESVYDKLNKIGDMQTSLLEYNSNSQISGYNGSAFAGGKDSVSSVNNVSAVSGNITIDADHIDYETKTYYAWNDEDWGTYYLFNETPSIGDIFYTYVDSGFEETIFTVESYNTETGIITSVRDASFTRKSDEDLTIPNTVKNAIENLGDMKVSALNFDANDKISGYNGSAFAIGESGTYTNLTPVPKDIGGITKGETFDNVSFSDMFDKLLYPYIAWVFGSMSITDAAGTYEYGTSKSITKSVINYTAGTKSITKIKFTDTEGNTKEFTTDIGEKSQTYTLDTAVSLDGTKDYTMTVEITDGTTTNTKTAKIVYTKYKYYATSTSDTTIPTTGTKLDDASTGDSITTTAGQYIWMFTPTESTTLSIQQYVSGSWYVVDGSHYVGTVTFTLASGASYTYYAYVTGKMVAATGSYKLK